jgi:UDP-N-acetylglucosamine:LPS N-acetylglucosamine transferase
MLDRVLLLSASAGAGHVRAAQGLERAFQDAGVAREILPGQEERNADHLLEEGAAIRCNNLPVLAYKIDRLLDDPGRLDALRRGARRLARPTAAADIVARLSS